MPLRPFPLQLGIGTDIVHVARIREIIQKAEGNPNHLERFLRRFLLPSEVHEFRKVGERLVENQLDATSKHLAGRWAAKEAVIKAVTWRRLSFHDIMIRRSQHNKSVVAIILDEVGLRSGAMNSEGLQVRHSGDHGLKRTEVSATFLEAQPVLPENDLLESGAAYWNEEITLTDTRNLHDLASDTSQESTGTSEHDLDEIHGQIAKVSISHDGEYATATCVVAEELGAGDIGGEASARELF